MVWERRAWEDSTQHAIYPFCCCYCTVDDWHGLRSRLPLRSKKWHDRNYDDTFWRATSDELKNVLCRLKSTDKTLFVWGGRVSEWEYFLGSTIFLYLLMLMGFQSSITKLPFFQVCLLFSLETFFWVTTIPAPVDLGSKGISKFPLITGGESPSERALMSHKDWEVDGGQVSFAHQGKAHTLHKLLSLIWLEI